MSRRKLENKNVRKLTRIGNLSLGLTIPVDMLRSLKWREKQKVVVKRRGKSLIINDWQSPSKPKGGVGKPKSTKKK